MISSTAINGRDVPILPGVPITILFAPGSPYPGDEGRWSFWSIFKEKMGVVTGRWRGEDPGERFRQMEGHAEYANAWALACVAEAIRPATQKEVECWLDGHPIESAFAETYQIGLK